MDNELQKQLEEFKRRIETLGNEYRLKEKTGSTREEKNQSKELEEK